MHAMQENALVDEALLAFEAKKSKGDYHGQFDWEIFPPVQVICTLPNTLVRCVSRFSATPPMSLKDSVHAQL